ncbi:MAG: RNA methyltransferase [Ignavibacteriaceae bacterium]|nr:RNA methyltransferase [Ignavibacteriaceae bacterium]
MRNFKSQKRLRKIEAVIKARQFSLKMILENIHDPHNVSAILRTCDAVGIPIVSLIYTIEKFPKIGKKSSASAFKWVEKEKFKSVAECYDHLRKNNYKIYASALRSESKSLYDLDLTGKTALVFGNEHRGVSDEAAANADELFTIPMFGMVQSLNVSVAAAVALYEAFRQRFTAGYYKNSELTVAQINSLIDEWCKK